MAKTVDGRVAYADLLRVLATFGVVVIHVCSIWFYDVGVSSAAWSVYNVYDGLVRWCVPLFVMLSGMFMLDPKKGLTLPGLFFRNILRVCTALVVWGALYAIADFGRVGGRFTWDGILSALRSALLGNTHYHLWFLYVILGLYLVTPILRAFVRGAGRRDFHYFFILCFVVAFLLPTLLQFRPSQTVSTYLARLNLHMVMGYVGFYVAGYYLRTYSLGRLAEVIIYILGVAGGAATVWGTSALSQKTGSLVGTLYDYMTPNVAAMAVAVSVLFRYLLGVSDERGRRRSLAGIAKVTFGIYLVHDFFITLFRHFGLTALPISPVAAVPLMTALVFLCSFAAAWVIGRIPFVGKYLT